MSNRSHRLRPVGTGPLGELSPPGARRSRPMTRGFSDNTTLACSPDMVMFETRMTHQPPLRAASFLQLS